MIHISHRLNLRCKAFDILQSLFNYILREKLLSICENYDTSLKLYAPKCTNQEHCSVLLTLLLQFTGVIATHFGNVLLFLGRAFSNRVPHMLDNDYSPKSALDLLAKDLVRISTRGFSDFLLRLVATHRNELTIDTGALAGYNTRSS